jgi:hypothetical protein
MKTPSLNRTRASSTNPKNSFSININSAIEDNKILQDELKRLESERNRKISKRKSIIEKYERELEENKQFKIKMKKSRENEENSLKEQIKGKEKTFEGLKNSILEIMAEIKEINVKMETHRVNENFLISKRKDKLLSKIKDKRKEILNFKKEIKRILISERKKFELDKMLSEDLRTFKVDIINTTSQIESIYEYIENMHVQVTESTHTITQPEFKISMLEFKFINKEKLSSLIYEKLNSLRTEEDPQISKKNFLLNLYKVYLLAFSFTIDEVIERIIIEISILCKYLNKLNIDLETLVKANMKLLFYEHLNIQRMNYINKESQLVTSNEIIKKDFSFLQDRIRRKRDKINLLKSKIADIDKDQSGYFQNQQENRNNVTAMEQEIDQIKILQDNIRYEVSMLADKINNLRLKYDEEINFVKEKNHEIKIRIKEQKAKIDKYVERFDKEIESRKKLIIENTNLLRNMVNVVNEDDCNFYQAENEKTQFDYNMKNNLINRTSRDSREKERNHHLMSNSFRGREMYLLKKPADEIILQDYENALETDDIDLVEKMMKKRWEKAAMKSSNRETSQTRHQINYNIPESNIIWQNPTQHTKNYVNFPSFNRTMNNNHQKHSLLSSYNSSLRQMPPTQEKNSSVNKSSSQLNNYLKNQSNLSHKKTYSGGPPGGFDNPREQNKSVINYNPLILNKDELLIIEKMRPLIEGCLVYKRSFVTLNKKSTFNLDYSPIDFRNLKLNPPEDSNFKKYFLTIDKGITKINFNKVRNDDKSTEVNITSINRLVVPKITKDLIFLKGVHKKLLKMNVTDVNRYIESHTDKLIKLYNRNDPTEIDERLFLEEYRQLLMESSKYMMYIYLKPDDETRIELIFTDYSDFKHWINGMESILNNKEVKDVIRKKMI